MKEFVGDLLYRCNQGFEMFECIRAAINLKDPSLWGRASLVHTDHSDWEDDAQLYGSLDELVREY